MNTVALFLPFLIFSIIKFTQSVEEDVEVIFLPLEWDNSNLTVPLSFTAFGKEVNLTLEKNKNLLNPDFEIWKRDGSELNKVDDFANSSSCHYLHKNSFSSAAVSLCDSGTVHGFVFLEKDSLEITPLSNEDTSIFKSHRQVRSSHGKAHVIKRRRIPSNPESQIFDTEHIKISPRLQEYSTYDEDYNEINEKAVSILTIELAVFLDEAAYRLFNPHLSNDKEKLLDMMLAYVNNIQALYYHPSLGQPINIALVRLELMQRQPNALAHLDGERGETLDAFCAYAKSINPPNDYDPKHWDMGLYISGLDFYATENGKKNFVTMGLAPVGGVCWDTYACVIAEFGVVNRFGRPYPSTGFTSLYVAAHEIGHNLGMSHDSTGNTCPKDGYIMSPSRGTHGETHWSSCSRDVVSTLATSKRCLLDRPNLDFRHEANQHLDHQGKFGQLPGRRWSAKRQCEILLRDPDAAVDTLKDCCRGLKCSSSKRIGFYFAGPALDGTKCDESRECKAGDCLPIEDEWPLINPPSDNGSGWSNWNDNNCTSGCIRGSLGSFERRRTCLSDTSTCPGLNFDVFLCKDNHLCDRGTRKRLSATEYAGQRCLEFSQHLEVIDGTSGGLQADHEENRPWVACAIFCKRKDIASYYSPKLELNDLGLDAYFPDGTWCHKEGKENYFCRKHHCLSENFRFGKGLTNVNLEENNLLGPMNAKPNDNENHRLPTEVIRYFSLGMNGKPLLTKLTTKNALQVKDNDNNNDDNDDDDDDEDSWLDPKDYIELPTHEQPDEIETPYFM